jgi:hypothetical protein
MAVDVSMPSRTLMNRTLYFLNSSNAQSKSRVDCAKSLSLRTSMAASSPDERRASAVRARHIGGMSESRGE